MADVNVALGSHYFQEEQFMSCQQSRYSINDEKEKEVGGRKHGAVKRKPGRSHQERIRQRLLRSKCRVCLGTICTQTVDGERSTGDRRIAVSE